MELSHSGQNIFYLPPNGESDTTYIQTKEKLVHINVDKTKLSAAQCHNEGKHA